MFQPFSKDPMGSGSDAGWFDPETGYGGESFVLSGLDDGPNSTTSLGSLLPSRNRTIDCFDIDGWLVIDKRGIQLLCICAATLAVLLPLAISLIIFSTRKSRSSPIFPLSLVATVASITFFVVTIAQWVRKYQQPGSMLVINTAEDPTNKALEVVRRFLIAFIPWIWDFILLIKLLAFYPNHVIISPFKFLLILSIPLITKLRLALDVSTFMTNVMLIYSQAFGTFRYLTQQELEYKINFVSYVLRLADNMATSALLIYKSVSFYRRSNVALAITHKRIRLLVESLIMSFVGIVPVQLLLVVFYGRLIVGGDESAYDGANILLLIDLALSAVFGLFATVWSSIGGTNLLYSQPKPGKRRKTQPPPIMSPSDAVLSDQGGGSSSSSTWRQTVTTSVSSPSPSSLTTPTSPLSSPASPQWTIGKPSSKRSKLGIKSGSSSSDRSSFGDSRRASGAGGLRLVRYHPQQPPPPPPQPPGGVAGSDTLLSIFTVEARPRAEVDAQIRRESSGSSIIPAATWQLRRRTGASSNLTSPRPSSVATTPQIFIEEEENRSVSEPDSPSFVRPTARLEAV